MGFSTTAAFVLLFITGLIAFGVLATVTIGELKEINKIMKIKNKKTIELQTTNFEIINVTAINVTTTEYNLTVVIKNTGSTTLDCVKFTLLVDGKVINATSNVSVLYPLECAEFNASYLSGTVGSVHRLKVVSDDGIGKYANFIVR